MKTSLAISLLRLRLWRWLAILLFTSLPSIMFAAGFIHHDSAVIGLAAIAALFSWAALTFVWIDESAEQMLMNRQLYLALLSSQRQVIEMGDRPIKELVTPERLAHTDVYDLYAFLVMVVFALRANVADRYTGLCPHCGGRLVGDPHSPDFHESTCPQFNELADISQKLEPLVQKVAVARSGEVHRRIGPEHQEN